MPAWDQDLHVLSPAGRPLADLLAEGPRRQELPGFDPIYRDFVDYIIRCTHRIWEEKNPGLCRSHYSEDCRIHTLAGPVTGAEAVVQNTIGSLASVSDRILAGEDVIWSEDGPGLFYSSHRIMSRMTHLGDDPVFGFASGRTGTVMTIADCLCRDNLIVEEWLVRDNVALAWSFGCDPWVIAERQAEADQAGDPSRHQWRADAIAATRNGPSITIAADHPGFGPARMLSLGFSEGLFGEAAAFLSQSAEMRWPSGRRGFGRGYWIGCVTQLLAMLHGAAFRIEHHAARPLPGGDVAVALRWSLTGRHDGVGPWGPPSGREILVMAVSHFRLRNGVVVEDITVFDELAALRQVAGGLGA